MHLPSLTASPIALLLATGAIIGLTFPLGKFAMLASISPLTWAFLISAGSATLLTGALVALKQGLPFSARHVRYYVIAGTISYALPNALVFSVISHLGVGLTSILYAFSPILTLLLSVVVRQQKLNLLGAAGIACGFAGALLIASSKGPLNASPSDLSWSVIGFVIPIFLAAGNVYRSADWPQATSGLALAVGTNLAAALLLLTAAYGFTEGLTLSNAASAWKLTLAQVIASALMFSVFFALQRVGGPVYLSQIGYVAAAVGLATGTLFLNETYGWLTWAGAAIVAAGIAMTTLAQRPTKE